MKLSIIIPCYNCKNSIVSLLQDLQKQKVYFKYEIILIDDFSTDGTNELLENSFLGYKNIIIKHNSKNKGNGYSKNLGTTLAKGEILLFLDDHCSIDDPFFLQKYITCYDCKEISGVCCFYEAKNIDYDFNYIRDLRRALIYKKQKYLSCKITQTMWMPFSIVVGGMRKKVLENTPFPTDFGQFSSEDTLLQLILEQDNKVLYYNGNIQCFHTHNLSLKDIFLKLKTEVMGTYLLYKKIQSLDLHYRPQKLYLDSIFIPIILIVICFSLNKILFFGIIFFLSLIDIVLYD